MSEVDRLVDERLLAEVVQRLTRIEVKLEEIVAVRRNVNDLQKDVEQLRKDGIELKTKNEQQRKELDQMADNNRWISRAVIGAVISSGVAILFTILKLGLKI